MHTLRVFLLALLSLATARAQTAEWIWHTAKAADGEVRFFRKTFTVPAGVTEATLLVSGDNHATAYLNGAEVAKTDAWADAAKARVEKQLRPGENVLAIRGKNDDGVAAVVARIEAKVGGAKQVLVVTDTTWLSGEKESAGWSAAEFKAEGWGKPVTIAKLGDAPWGDVFAGAKRGGSGAAADPESLTVAAGFKVELIYTVPKAEQGSWVSMTEDAKGRLIVGDQYGGLFRVTVPPLGTTEGTKVEPLALPSGLNGKPLGGAHGLLYAFNSLYVMNNEMDGKGLWRLRDTNGDDHFDQAEYIVKCSEGGEHGVHGVVLGPDGKSIYFVAGNHTKVPEHLDAKRPVAIGEDHLITRMWDANGHAKGILAPGGYVCKTDADGKRVELFAGGFRNMYDIAFDANGELFTYDSDMEWDMGTPWYMPTRINHIVSGGDYGWRSGSGRWP